MGRDPMSLHNIARETLRRHRELKLEALGDQLGDITLRDLFAAAALAGIVAKHGVADSLTGFTDVQCERNERARAAYRQADAMLMARQRQLEAPEGQP